MIVVVFFVVAFAIGMPIAFVLGGTGIVHAFALNDVSLFYSIPQRTFAAINNFSLMAIPLFILAGEIMGYGGITEKLCDMMRSFVGHIKGGMAYTTVLVGTALGALLGSANASAALLGKLMYKEMLKDGYEDGFSASLVCATSILGPIIPPSMVFIMYGVQANESISKLFFAGIAPGLLITAGYFIVIGFYAKHSNWDIRPKTNFKTKLKNTLKALPALFIPVIILGGILGGITTPTEAAATASFAAILIGAFYYKKLKLSDIPKILESTGVLSSAVLLIVAFAYILGWTLALDQIPQKIASILLSITSNKYLLLMIINIMLFIIGMLMDTTAAIILLVPVLVPVIKAVGIDSLHFGMVMCVNLIIGLMTPPFGGALFTTLMVTGVPSSKVIKEIWPWVGAAVVVLLLITYIPGLVTFLPNMLIK